MSSRPEGGSLPPATEPIFEVFCSRHFTGWLAEARLSLCFTTYQVGKLFFLGLHRDGKRSVFNRTLSRCMGLWGDGQTLYLSTLFQLWRFENSLGPGETYQGYGRLYVPRVGTRVRLSGVVTELYDVVALPGVIRPMALGFRNDEVQRMISVGSWATWGKGNNNR